MTSACNWWIAGFFDYPAADIDIEMWRTGSRTYRVYLGNYGVKSTVGAVHNIPTDLIFRLESFIRQLVLHEAYHWVRWFVSTRYGTSDTVEFLIDNQPLEAGEELLRAVTAKGWILQRSALHPIEENCKYANCRRPDGGPGYACRKA